MNSEQKIILFTKKNPQWQKVFLDWYEADNDIDLSQLESTFHKLILNKQALKDDISIQWATSLCHPIHSSQRSKVEALDDKIQAILHIKRKESFIRSLKTVSYSHLFNKDIENEIHVLLDNKISIALMKSQVFNKLARFQSPIELLNALIDFREQHISWSKISYLNKIKDNNLAVNIIESDENTLMIQVIDYKACNELGSQSWCIVYDKDYFDSYTDELSRQFIFLDFNENIESNISMIGITVDFYGSITNAHRKDDSEIYHCSELDFEFKPTSENEIDTYFSKLNFNSCMANVCNFGLVSHYYKYMDKIKLASKIELGDWAMGAVQEGNLEIISHMIENFDLSCFFYELLDRATLYSHIEIIKLIFSHSKFELNMDGIINALQTASLSDDTDILEFLLDLPGIDPSANSNRCLILALGKTKSKAIDLLLNHPNIKPSYSGNIVIKEATLNLNIRVISLLLKHEKIDKKEAIQVSFDIAVRLGHIPILTFLESQMGDLIIDKNTAVIVAADHNHLSTLELILKDENVDPSINNNQALRVALSNNYTDIVRRLLKCPEVNLFDANLSNIKTTIRHQNTALLYIFFEHKHISDKIKYLVDNHHFNDQESTALCQFMS